MAWSDWRSISASVQHMRPSLTLFSGLFGKAVRVDTVSYQETFGVFSTGRPFAARRTMTRP
jgi:hypothetical protein